MATILVKNNIAMVLPKALEGEEGFVDRDILYDITHVVRQGSKKIRNLISKISGDNISPKEDVTERLCELIVDAQFLARWQGESRSNPCPPFTALVSMYVLQRDKAFDLESEELTGCFEKRKINKKDKFYPVLSQLEKLVSVIKGSDTEPRVKALFAWLLQSWVNEGLNENSNEPSLVGFEAGLRAALSAAGLGNILELTTAASWKETSPANISGDTDAKTQPNEERKHSPAEQQNPVNTLEREVSAEIRELEGAIQKYKIGLQVIAHKSKLLSKEGDQVALLTAIIDTAENSRATLHKIEKDAREVITKIDAEISEHANRFGLKLTLPIDEKFSIFSLEEWSSNILKRTEVSQKCRDDFNYLLAAGNAKGELAARVRATNITGYNQLLRHLSHLKLLSDRYTNGTRGIETFRSAISKNYKDLKWNPFLDQELTADIWLAIARFRMHEKRSDQLLGIIVCRYFDALNIEFANYLEQVLGNFTKEGFIESVNLLSWLSLGQLEKISDLNKPLRNLIAIGQIDGYFKAIKLGLDRYVYWSSTPLREIVSNPSSNNFDGFLKELYSVSVGGEENTLTTKQILLLASSAKIQNDRSKSELDLESEMFGKLVDILTFRRKGGKTTYAEIWEAAYLQTIQPLQNTLNELGTDAFISDYASWCEGFNIEAHIDGWKSGIAEHLKKNSAYDKFIRKQMSLKIHEIDDWVRLYASATQLKEVGSVSAVLTKFKKALGSIFMSSDVESLMLQYWLDAAVLPRRSTNNSYINQQQDFSGRSLATYVPFRIDAYHPRAFAKLNGCATYGDIYADDAIHAMDFNSPLQLAELYAKNKNYEGYAFIADEYNEQLPAALDRQMERETEELSLKLGAYLSDIRARCKKLHDIEGQLSTFNTKLEDLYGNQQWSTLEREIVDFDQFVTSLEEDHAIKAQRDKLMDDISRLGGEIPARARNDINKLRDIWARLETDLMPRRAHIDAVKRLEGSHCSDIELKERLKSCLEYLDYQCLLPSSEVSEYVTYFLNQAIVPLTAELDRLHTLLPSYAKQLLSLANCLVANIQEDSSLFSDDSPLIAALADTAEYWHSLSTSGKSGIDKILNVFVKKGLFTVESQLDKPERGSASMMKPELVLSETAISFESIRDLLVAKAKYIVEENERRDLDQTSVIGNLADIYSLILEKKWSSVSAFYLAELRQSAFSSDDSIVSWAISSILDESVEFQVLELSNIISVLMSRESNPLVKQILGHKSLRTVAGELLRRFMLVLADSLGQEKKLDKTNDSIFDVVNYLFANLEAAAKFRNEFKSVFNGNMQFEKVAIRSLWERFAGESKQAEGRAYLMYIAWHFHLPSTLATYLALSPIDLERRTAEALAKVAEEALSSGKPELMQGFLDLKKSIQAKPFQIFVDLLLKNSVAQADAPAVLSMLTDLENAGGSSLAGILKIEPRKIDSPDQIFMKFPPNSPIVFDGPSFSQMFQGPFFTAVSIPTLFVLADERAVSFNVEVECTSTSLTGTKSVFYQKISFALGGGEQFSRLSPDEIDDAFDNFPAAQMRGSDYVPRIADEQKIEKSLFKSKTVRSLWLSSPRRSGKTTMLFRILDGYSHKEGRDSLVVYLTLDETVQDTTGFNRWIWKRILTRTPNAELRELYTDFELLGKNLPFDSDTGTFLGELSNRLLQNTENASRIIFLVDEIDRFASMYFEGGDKQKLAIDILWQIRHVINERRDIGLVFAGSSAAKQVFIENAESPFYNSIDHIELTPFSCQTKSLEEKSRQIVEPPKVKARYKLPKESLEHLIWVCAGIPYYMKLVSGATYAVASQSHILISDVNDGLRALLSKATGVSKLDDMGGDPGSDDLRTTITLERRTDGVIARAVLYAFADLHSPVSGHKTYRGRLSSRESKLVSHYNLPKKLIDRGIEICIGLGLISVVETDSYPEIDFVIPILGESIRNASGRLWANIDHDLAPLGTQGMVNSEV